MMRWAMYAVIALAALALAGGVVYYAASAGVASQLFLVLAALAAVCGIVLLIGKWTAPMPRV